MGHAKIDTTLNVYTQVIDESKRAAAQKISDELFTIVHSPDRANRVSTGQPRMAAKCGKHLSFDAQWPRLAAPCDSGQWQESASPEDTREQRPRSRSMIHSSHSLSRQCANGVQMGSRR